MNIAIVGSRGFTDTEAIHDLIRHLDHNGLTLVSGGARGADSIAELYARDAGIPISLYLPNWTTGRGAGYERNKLIVAEADIVYAFFAPGPRTPGTTHTVNLARAAGKPVHIYHEGNWS